MAERAQVLLYYCYARVADAQALAAGQDALCRGLRLRGRVRVASEGINGTLEGAPADLDEYKRATEEALARDDIDWKASPAEGDNEGAFAGLLVKVVDNLVAAKGTRMGRGDYSPERTGVHLSPQDFHAAISNAGPDEVALIDVRNQYEYEVGHFTGAINPSTRKFSDFEQWFTSEGARLVQGKQKVLMYCTGGIRCETASIMVKEVLEQQQQQQIQGDDAQCAPAPTVYQLKGGIHRYLEAFPDGHFGGRNFVFDGRVLQPGPAAAGAGVGLCAYCARPWDAHAEDRRCKKCRMLVLACDSCADHAAGLWCAHHVYLDPRRASRLDLDARRLALEGRLGKLQGRGLSRQRRKARAQLTEILEAYEQLEHLQAALS